MSQYFSAVSGMAVVFSPKEVTEFLTRYLLETYKKDGVTDGDVNYITNCVSDSFYLIRSKYRFDFVNEFPSIEKCMDDDVAEKHKNKLFKCTEYNEDSCSGGVLYPLSRFVCGQFVDVDNGSYIIYTDKSTRPQDLFAENGYKTIDEIVEEFEEKLAAYVPDDFDWESHIGFFQCAELA